MIAGYLIRYHQRTQPTQAACDRWSRRLKIACLGYLIPPVVVIAIIQRPLSGTNVLAMGAIGVTCLLCGALLGRIYIAIRRMPPRQAGAFLGCASMANMFSFGGLIVFSFWKNDGLQQLYLFELFKHFLYFGVFYPWCATFGRALGQKRPSLIGSFRAYPITLIPIGAVVIGLVMNFVIHGVNALSVTLPDWLMSVNGILVPLHVGLLTFAVGLTLRPSRISSYWLECMAVNVIAFVARPAITAGAAMACLALGWIDMLGFRAAILLAAMPVAFNSLIPPALYDLDMDLANSCWICSTVVMLIMVPGMYMFAGIG